MDILPREIINEIKYFYPIPMINIEGNFNGRWKDFHFIIKYPSTTIELQMIHSIRCYDEEILNKFLENLENNIDCFYDETQHEDHEGRIDFLEIRLINKTIIIDNKLTKINLSLEHKDQIISAMKKYRDTIKNYYSNIIHYTPPGNS